MADIDLGNPSPVEQKEGQLKHIDIKQANIHVQTVVDTPTLTPALTPEEKPAEDIMTGKKLFTLEKPDDRARELAASLSLEEQVCYLFFDI